MSGERVPPALLAAVRNDLRPVRPMPSPGWRALTLLPIGLVLLIAIPAFWGWRENYSELGAMVAWGLSAIQALVGLVVVGTALKEAIPGQELNRRAVAAVIGASAVLFVAITLVTRQVAPTHEPPAVWARFAWECFWMAATSSVPGLACAAWLVSRALPTRPAVAGAVYGLGAGLMADAGVRLFCWVSTPSHVLVAHGGSILALSAAGAGAARMVDAWQARRG
jgi:hypothetical protein